MAIDFPGPPLTVGQQFTAAGVTWTWDGTKWTASGLGVAYLPLAGGTMLGPIVLAADPAAALQPATKQYVDGGRLGDNRIINGDMMIDQRNNGAAGSTLSYTCDRWVHQATQTGKITWQRASGPSAAAIGFPYYFLLTSSSAYAALATDYFSFAQRIVADQISDFLFGSANAQPVTLSFWATSTQTGTFSGSLSNDTGARSYPFTFNIPVASTWTKVVVTIPGDTAGTWVMSGNATGVVLRFDLGSGANFRGPANAWAAANYIGVTGSVSIVATNAANFTVTGVKLEIGSVATPFNRQSLAKSLADCQRYCYQLSAIMNINGWAGAASQNVFGTVWFPATMRAAPTISGVGYGAATNVSTNGQVNIGPNSAQFYLTSGAVGLCSAPLQTALFSAEL